MDYLAYRTFDKDSNTVNWTQPPSNFTLRNGKWHTGGKKVAMFLNSYKVTEYPADKSIYQYDVSIGNGGEKRALMRKIWYSQGAKAALAAQTVQNAAKVPGANAEGVWLWDGNKIAWSTRQLKQTEIKFMIDLDQEPDARPVRAGKEGLNTHRVVIKFTKKIDTSIIAQYLAGNQTHSNAVIQAQSVFDHILRETPAGAFINHKQSFYMRLSPRTPLGGGVEALKGVYQSIRAAQGGNLTINVDVSNGVFWSRNTVLRLAQQLANAPTLERLITLYRPDNKGRDSLSYRDLRSRFKRLKFTVQHKGRPNPEKVFMIEGFTKYDETALSYTFEWAQTPDTPPRVVNVREYYQCKYGVSILAPDFPMVNAGRSGMFPMELCMLVPDQRYYYKLGPDQTSAMIKFAVTRPPARKTDIQNGVDMLAWGQDPVLSHFGLKVNPTMTKTEARVIAEPKIQMRGSIMPPGQPLSGKWKLIGKKFLIANDPLESWAVVSFSDKRKLPEKQLQGFVDTFVRVFEGHGGVIKNKKPEKFYENDKMTIKENLTTAYINACKQAEVRCQLLIVVVKDTGTKAYHDIKRECDTYLGIVSQVVQVKHVLVNKDEYHTNVAMKVNAKLGGTTSKIAVPNGVQNPDGQFSCPSIVIGADVSHGGAGGTSLSTAAVTVSLDRYAARYGAICTANGQRTEIIKDENMRASLRLVGRWVNTHRILPPHIYYFRDGVSEGQYQQVLDSEVACMKKVLKEKFSNWNPKFIVTIASKRHHIRFFPAQGVGYPEGNPHPGTLVERDVTHPFELDFYLCSHKAIQGTARPVHYHVILDETNLNVNKFQEMIFHHCYAYMRSTTPVSLYPAVYYAHLASNRCRAHIKEGEEPETGTTASNAAASTLLRVGHTRKPTQGEGCWDAMWYI